MSFTVRDFVHQAEAQIGRYVQNYDRFQTLAEDSEKRSQELRERLNTASAQLANALLPDLSEASFQALATKLALPELLSLFRQDRQHEAQLLAQIDAIEQAEAYRTREVVRGRAEHQLEEVKPLYDYALKDFQYLDALPWVRDLVARGYGTPQYAHQGVLRFFNREYLQDWKHADDICETLKVATFPEVAARYRDRKEESEVLGRSVGELQGKLDEIARMEAERERLIAERSSLPNRLRIDTGKRIASLLKTNPALGEKLENADVLKARITEIDGMEHQVEYLESLRLRIQEDAAQIQERADKLNAERQRYASDLHRYRNKVFTQEQFDKRFRYDDRYDRLYDRYSRTSQTVYVFHDYDRASLLEDYLWWDIITDGRLNGSYIPEVQTYYDAHPDYTYDRSVFSQGAGVGVVSGGTDFDPNFGGDPS